MSRTGAFLFVCLAACLLLLSGPSAVLAHDVDYIFSDVELGGGLYELEHDDQSPWKGWLDLTVTNSGNEAWGDFHFEIYQVPGQGSVENIDWIDSTGYEPTSSQNSLTWTIYKCFVSATLDLYFYGDPVLPDDTATF